MTALVIIVTNNHTASTNDGVALTSIAFDSTIPGFRYILTVAIVLFAFSTMLSWSYYGLQAWKYLFGKGKGVDIAYKIIFCVFVVIGAAARLECTSWRYVARLAVARPALRSGPAGHRSTSLGQMNLAQWY
jgi:Na+/alanine symporter